MTIFLVLIYQISKYKMPKSILNIKIVQVLMTIKNKAKNHNRNNLFQNPQVNHKFKNKKFIKIILMNFNFSKQNNTHF